MACLRPLHASPIQALDFASAPASPNPALLLGLRRRVFPPTPFCSPAVLSTYDVGVHDLAQKVLGYIRRQTLIHAGDRVAIAVSAGADSVALLRLLLELRHLRIGLSDR